MEIEVESKKKKKRRHYVLSLVLSEPFSELEIAGLYRPKLT
jgi:hypothetical protein